MSVNLSKSGRPRLSTNSGRSTFSLAFASSEDREQIYHLRHETYARELGQHAANATAKLSDPLDDYNVYLVAWQDEAMAGFISITPPGDHRFSVDKYFGRDQMPFAVNDRLYEIRLLTVVPGRRGRECAALLMSGALRYVESRAGTRIVAIGRKEVLSLYLSVGMIPTGLHTESGRVRFELLHAPVETIRRSLDPYAPLLDKIETKTDWQLDIPFRKPAACFHGGAFFKAVGERFDSLDRAAEIINADVLDAWFPPSEKVVNALREHLPWLVRTSPPTDARGLIDAISDSRGISPECVLPGAGSSDLIFLAFQHWLTRDSRVLILDPMYGEYAHVLEQVIRCQVDRLPLHRDNGYQLDPKRLSAALARGYDLVVLVNPNSPTGRSLSRDQLEECFRHIAPATRVWLDETYVDYLGREASLERFATRSANVVVCKSMSKVYALSGVRAAYLAAAPQLLESLRSKTPPWSVSLPAQVAAVKALEDPDYYQARWNETHRLRELLLDGLQGCKMEVVAGQANFLLAHLSTQGPDAATVITRCREKNLFLRNAAVTSPQLGDRAIRIAVKDEATIQEMLTILRGALELDARSTPYS